MPTVPTAEAEAGAPADLPTITTAFAVPSAVTPTPEAGLPADLPTITTGFNVPVAVTPTAEAGAAAQLPTLTEVFSIPTAPTPTAVAGANELGGSPQTTEMFSIPNSKSPLGLATDGTNFYILVNGTPDQVYKVNATGTLDTSFSGDGIIDVTHNTSTRDNAQGIAYVGGNLYVAEESWREDGQGNSILKFSASTGAEADITSGDNSCAIPNFDRFTGLHADGSRLWGIVDWGGKFVKITTDCTEVTSINTWPHNAAHGLAVGSGDHEFFFVSEGEKLVKRNKDNAEDTGISWTITNFIVKGLTYHGGLLYIADADLKKVHKANIPHGQTVTTSPRGVAYDGQYLYILVDASPTDKIVVVDPNDTSAPPAIVRSFNAPDSSSDAMTYANGFLWVAQERGCCDREIKKLDPVAGNVVATLTLNNPIHQPLAGLGYDGTDLIGFLKTNDQNYYGINSTTGDAETVMVNWDVGSQGYRAGTFRDSTDRAYGAKNNVIYEFTDEGEQRQSITVTPSTTDIEGMTWVGANLWLADDSTDKIYKGSIGHGIAISTDPLALATNGTTTLYILVDGTPKDVILEVSITSTALTSQFDAPDDEGEGLTYLDGSLYYASNSEGPRKIYVLDPSTGLPTSNFNPQYPWGEINDNLLGLGNDGSDLNLSTSRDDFYNQCLEVIDSINGGHEGQLCSGQASLGQARGVAVAPDGFILIAEDDTIVQLDPEGNEANRWTNLDSLDIQGLAFAGNTLYIANDSAGTDTIVKAAVPTGINITTDPLALAANGTTTLYILVDATPNDVILEVSITSTALTTQFDAPDDKGEDLTYLGGNLYYASNKDGNKRVYVLDPSTGLTTSSFEPTNQWGGTIGENLLGLGNDGTDVLISTNNPWDPCLDKVDTAGNHEARLCADYQEGLMQATGVAVAPDDFILIGKGDELVQLDPQGRETNNWLTLASVDDIQGLAFVGSTIYIADDSSGTDQIYKASVPSGINVTTNPLALAAIGTTTLAILVDATPVDKILIVSVTSTDLVKSFDAPDDEGEGLTYTNGSLYYFGREEFGPAKIYELDPDTGAVLGSVSPNPPKDVLGDSP